MPALADEIKDFLREHGLRLKKSLGQNFLIEATVLESIVEAAGIGADDHVVEIGPGIGVLTRELVQVAKHVTAIEFDEDLIPLLHEFVNPPPGKLSVIRENALRADYPTEPYRIVANIPYHITSPLMRRVFLESPKPPLSLTLLIQREVAEKICDDTDAGILTIIVKLFGTPRLVRVVPPAAFIPQPKVDSAVLQIDCFDSPLADPQTIERVLRLTKQAFGQKRKMLRNTLGSTPEGEEKLRMIGVEPTRRPQTLSVDEWIALARTFQSDTELPPETDEAESAS